MLSGASTKDERKVEPYPTPQFNSRRFYAITSDYREKDEVQNAPKEIDSR